MSSEEILEKVKGIIVELIMAIEEEFDIEIPDSDAEKVVTVGDVVDYIKENVQ